MDDRIRTLLLEANGTHPLPVALDTLGQGLFTARDSTSSWINKSHTLRKVFGERYATSSYLHDWRDAFSLSRRLQVEVCNITNLLEFHRNRRKIREYDLVVVLHSAAGDRMWILNKAASWFQERRGKLAVFIGNEYGLMREKISFLQESRADYICSQLPLETAKALYDECPGTVVPMPHALNPDAYCESDNARDIDVGFVGDLYDRLIGDRERTDIVEFLAAKGKSRGLRCDIRTQRMPREAWAAYLNRCHGVVGAESGTYFLQRSGEALACAAAWLKTRPAATFDEVYQRCFQGCTGALNGKAVSSRHFEPIGTRTCQLLVEGAYNGILVGDVHYIAVKKDLSNIDNAIDRFKDPEFRKSIADAAYDLVMNGHTYQHRVDELIRVVFASPRSAVSVAV